MIDPKELADRFKLQPLPGEGGLFSPLFRGEEASAIYFMMINPDFSAWHRIPESEMWIHVAGSPTLLYTLDELSKSSTPTVARYRLDNSSNQYIFTVPPDTWMAAKPEKEWSLVLCSLVPAFTEMELASSEAVQSWSDSLRASGALELASEVREFFHA